MKLLVIIIFVMLSVLITDIASTHHWQKGHKQTSKTKYEHKGCNCLNGGTCVSYQLFSQIKRCLCPKGYSGNHCEIDSESQCYTGNGEDYRGTESVNENSERCLDWDSPSLRRQPYNEGMEDAMKLGLGKHNYCRNPDGQSKPWCYIRKGFQMFSTPCNINVCQKEPTCGQRSFSKYFKIVGGHKAAIESQPWIATIFQSDRKGSNQFLCGGSLIDACWILTAAHCFESKTDPSKLTVILGKSELYIDDTRQQKFNVDRIVIHEEYSQQRMDYDNDIALIRIRSSSGQCAEESDTVKTICLPSQNLLLRDNFQCEVSGYGKEKKTAIYYSRILKSTNVNLISQSLCQIYYEGRKVNGNMFCAGDPTWKTDSCKSPQAAPG
ncbi:urokinase-type plasminogen activator isoform X2 [Rhineura floridana]|uniref:urokinase-type plasminogen activator isoform X2 n=1 Tax=Rhineura floridana TaxID=261503 RepID=UPI002AC8495C|nr:urokinase-type plasminogen activator isoform X2 [Rhineura floridana]